MRRGFAPAASIALLVTMALVSGLPLGWMLWHLVTRPDVWVELKPTAFRLDLLGRTIGYNLAAAMIATILSLPAAMVLGRGRGAIAKLLWIALPVSLFIPSIVYSYGWMQVLRLAGVVPDFQSAGDVLRCIWSLATWLLPLPAFVIGLALRNVDADLQQQAMLDGRLWRVTLRQLAGPIVAAVLLCTVLAVQEFAVYEPTGISVIATEVRMVFDTGAASSNLNPIVGEISPTAREGSLDQRARAAAAVATSIPMLALVAACGLAAIAFAKRASAADAIDAGPWPGVLDARPVSKALCILVLLIAAIVPLAALAVSLKTSPGNMWRDHAPDVLGTLLVGAITAVAAAAVAVIATAGRSKLALIVGLLTFLVGGQLLAIALIRLYNRPATMPIYDSAAIAILAYLARFGWIAILAGRFTTSPRWRELRQMAAVDGATGGQTVAAVILPIAWPILLAAAVCVMTLAMTEVPATVLLSPMRPKMLIPIMMTWVHTLRFDPMIEASLLLVACSAILAVTAVVLVRLGVLSLTRTRTLTVLLTAGLLAGCGSGKEPDEIWLQTGTGPGYVVYPRAITYDKASDTFYVVDRTAHVQRLDKNGKPMAGWHMPEQMIGKPVGLSVGPDGNVYVPDTHYQRVIVYDPTGREVRRWGSSGTGPGQFIYPTDIAFDAHGRVFVSEYGDHDRIQVFDAAGKYLYEIGSFGDGDGQFRRPQSMVIAGDTLYVTDSCNHRIVVFKTDGTFVKTIGRSGGAPGEFRFPYGLDQDEKGRLVVTEFGGCRVQLIDPDSGKSLGAWGLPGREPGELAYPWAAVVDSRGRIVTVDAGNNRLQLFRF